MKHRPKIRTPHVTPLGINSGWPKFAEKFVIRFGASSKSKEIKGAIEINSLAAISQNASKLQMKQIFAANGISSPEFGENNDATVQLFKDNDWNVVYKTMAHSGGKGMIFAPIEHIDSLKGKVGILERRINTKREWRVHVIPGINQHLSVEKLRRKDKLDNPARNLENCIFKMDFISPDNWEEAIKLCYDATQAIGLHFAAVDLAWSGKKYYVIETNTGPGLGEKTRDWYRENLLKLIQTL